MKRDSFFLLLLLIAVPLRTSCVSAAEGEPLRLTLQSAMEIASQKNPSVLMADERVAQALERLNQARSFLFPEVSATTSWQRQTRNLESFGLPAAGAGSSSVVGPFNVFDARAQITQTLFDLGMIRRLRAVRLGQELSKSELVKAKEDALALTAALYLQARRAHDAIGLSKELLRLWQQGLRVARSRSKLGAGSELELKQAIARCSQSRSEWRMAMTQASARLLDLKAALALSPGQAVEFAEEPAVPLSVLPSAAEIDEKVGTHPDIAVLHKQVELKQAFQKAEQADYFPKISAGADYGVNGQDFGGSKDTYSYGVRAAWPLFEGGAREGRIAEAESQVRESRLSLEDLTRRTESGAWQAKQSLKDARQLVISQEQQWDFRKERSASVKAQLRNGSASVFDWLEARAEEARSRDQRQEAIATYTIAQIHLAHALGQTQSFSNFTDRRVS